MTETAHRFAAGNNRLTGIAPEAMKLIVALGAETQTIGLNGHPWSLPWLNLRLADVRTKLCPCSVGIFRTVSSLSMLGIGQWDPFL